MYRTGKGTRDKVTLQFTQGPRVLGLRHSLWLGWGLGSLLTRSFVQSTQWRRTLGKPTDTSHGCSTGNGSGGFSPSDLRSEFLHVQIILRGYSLKMCVILVLWVAQSSLLRRLLQRVLRFSLAPMPSVLNPKRTFTILRRRARVQGSKTF